MERQVASVVARVGRTLRRYDMVGNAERVLVAVSGGPDSGALLWILARLRREWNGELLAAHVNHRLRGADAEADEDCARQAAERLGIGFVRAELGGDLGRGGNLEERARVLRYQALQRMARENGCARIATGHTRDDQAETVLLRLIRGSAPAGLGGIEPCRGDGVIRPLIDCSRRDVLRVIAAAGISCREDQSNHDLRFLRNRLRLQVLPGLEQINPAVRRNLAHVADLLRAQAAVVDEWATRELGEREEGDGLVCEKLVRLPPGLRSLVLAHWLAQAGMPQRRLTARHLGALERLAIGGRASGSIELPGRYRAAVSYGVLRLGGKPQEEVPAAGVQELVPGCTVELAGWRIVAGALESIEGAPCLPADLYSALVAADSLSVPLEVRLPRRGERIRPLGSPGRRKLSDVFIDRKIPQAERWIRPLVAFRGEVAWVPGVARAEVLRVVESTREVCRLTAARVGK